MAVLGASLSGSTVGRFWHAAWHEVTFAAPDTVLLLGAADVREGPRAAAAHTQCRPLPGG